MDSASHCPQPTAAATKGGKRKTPSWALISIGFASWPVCKLYRVWIASRSGAVRCYTATAVETMSADGTLYPVWIASASGAVCCYTATAVETMSRDGTAHSCPADDTLRCLTPRAGYHV
jgi:hypothetical protein